jgi:acyl carrier protein
MLAERVTTVIANFTQIPPERITPDMTFPELGLDSLQALNLLYELENEFQVAIPNARALQIRCVRDLLEVMGDLKSDEGGATQQADLPKGLPAAGGD